jgi:hypothetical protein
MASFRSDMNSHFVDRFRMDVQSSAVFASGRPKVLRNVEESDGMTELGTYLG